MKYSVFVYIAFFVIISFLIFFSKLLFTRFYKSKKWIFNFWITLSIFILILSWYMFFFSDANYVKNMEHEHPYFRKINLRLAPTPKIFYNYFFTPVIDINKIDIPVYKFYIKQEKIDQLNSNLPLSGFEYVSGYLEKEGEIYEAKFHYRGGGPHLLHYKKSWRVKLKDDKIIDGADEFNIVNPKWGSHINLLVGYNLAEIAGLTTFRSYPVALFINDRYAGVQLYLDQFDETYIITAGKIPGDLYAGDKIENSVPELWTVVVDSAYDGNITRANQTVDYWRNHVYNDTLLEFHDFFEAKLGEKYLDYIAYQGLISSEHNDFTSNTRTYFNPSSGMLEPFFWDPHTFLDATSYLYSYNKVVRNIILTPEYLEYVNQKIYSYMTNDLTEEFVVNYIDQQASLIQYEIYHDIYKDESNYEIWSITNEDWEEYVEDLKLNVHQQYERLLSSFSIVELAVFVVDNKFLVFDVNGFASVDINNLYLKQTKENGINQCLKLYKNMNFNESVNQNNLVASGCEGYLSFSLGRLYSGRYEQGEPATLRYIFLIEKEPGQDIILESLDAVNSITGEVINPSIYYIDSIEQLPIAGADSLHPWLIDEKPSRELNLSGKVILENDLILSKKDNLTIASGTEILLGENVSIISYGRIIAEGEKSVPIKFMRLNKNSPWGTIALQGKESAGSIFSNVVFDGGSGDFYDFVTYTGMVSVYNSEANFSFSTFANNTLYDDMFNAKYSEVSILDSEFINSKFDAIDFDITNGNIKRNTFVNIGGDAIDLMTSNAHISENIVLDAGDKGISIGEASYPLVIANIIQNTLIAIAIKDKSDPIIINNTIKNNTVGVASYQKNWRYGGGGLGVIEGTKLCDNVHPISIMNQSEVIIYKEDQIITCSENDCELDCN
ncbi:hypothetical protein COV16_07150 [Candidatus Woesearchaeota archaeon CG10_big_fil_rev_8_21_14_0_10_34_8]|nr:MAG: hypothetical protein COV16_07150 [Candidatus Woesearchaeota archaeon CG10_big_fil_rev_8_21_14_0_10_34_8]